MNLIPIDVGDQLSMERSDDDCDIRFVTNMNFRDLDDLRQSSFADWWPAAAKTVIAGIFAEQDSQRAAVRALLPLLSQYKYSNVLQPRMMTGELEALQHMLSSRLMFEEHYIKSVKDAWKDSISSLTERCMHVFAKNRRSETQMHAYAERLEREYRDRVGAQLVHDTIAELLSRYKKKQCQASAMALKLLRAESLHVHIIRRPDTRQLDDRIESFCRNAPAASMDGIRCLRAAYATRLANVEYEMAEDIKDECRCQWIRALQRSG